uniref:Germin-like protein n=1 Tax=Oryza nivara TaxID=4536 RepID=A0A0E0GR54_ORYNI
MAKLILATFAVVFLALAATSLAGDPDMLQDVCVADYNPPHTHPRATEIMFVAEGTLDVGFVTTANKLFTRTVSKGEVFVFPRGLVHFQRNSGNTSALAIAAFNSQLPGTQSIADTLFGAAPPLPSDTLARAFQVDGGMVESIKSKFPPKY